MAIAVLYPRQEFATTAERYASWQAQSQLRRDEHVAEIIYYDLDERAGEVMASVAESHVLVVIDPLQAFDPRSVDRLFQEHGARDTIALVVPAASGPEPALYFCAGELLRREKRPLRQALSGHEVIQATSVTAAPWRSTPIPDLLDVIPSTARAILHTGCGESLLGQEIKQRQRCRVIGIESDRELASRARRRLDDVYIGDIEEVVAILSDPFDCIIAAGVLEQVEDPWALLSSLRRISAIGGTLVASIPNLAHVGVIADLMDGHFEPARQSRWFTRESIEELVDIAGWELETVRPHTSMTAADEEMAARLEGAGLQLHEDRFVRSFIVLARCPER